MTRHDERSECRICLIILFCYIESYFNYSFLVLVLVVSLSLSLSLLALFPTAMANTDSTKPMAA